MSMVLVSLEDVDKYLNDRPDILLASIMVVNITTAIARPFLQMCITSIIFFCIFVSFPYYHVHEFPCHVLP